MKRKALQMVTVFATMSAFGGGAWAIPWTPLPATADAPTVPAPSSPTQLPSDAAEAPGTSSGRANVLRAADAAVAAGDLDRARILFDELASAHPDTPEGREARRALDILAAAGAARARAPSSRSAAGGARLGFDGRPRDGVAPDPDADVDHVVIRHEPYSTRTSERLRLTTWEKLDFGVTSFLYGMSVGASYAIGIDTNDSSAVMMPIALGAAVYTLGAVAFLKIANPDRGDLPLALAITSYIPTTTLLIANIAFDNPDEKKIGFAVAGAGLLSVPIAIAAAQKLDLDPGDTQLVRDSGFWGLVLATTGTLGFGGTSSSPFAGYSYYQEPDQRTTATMSLIGLSGGLGLGILGASLSEVSLERVRVSTWGGYGGALLGAMMGLGISDNDAGVYRGTAIGALGGLLITFFSTSSLDGIPPDEGVDASAADHRRVPSTRWIPTMFPVADASGRPLPSLGFSGALP